MLSFKFIGIEKLTKKLSGDTIKKPLTDGIKKIVLTLEGETKKATVVDTGRLRASIFSKFGATSGMVGTNVQYADFVEYGTPRVDARHMEAGTKVFGQGMFSFGFDMLRKRMSGLLKSIGVQIENRWGK